jgi:hypothetical protein
LRALTGSCFHQIAASCAIATACIGRGKRKSSDSIVVMR